MNNFLLVGTLDPGRLLAEIRAHEGLWKQGTREQYDGSAHARSCSIILRGPPPKLFEKPAPGEHASALNAALSSTAITDWPAAVDLMPAIGEAVLDVLACMGPIGDIGHVLLTRLPPGESVTAHTDEGIYATLFDRFHVCLQGDEGNVFECAGETFRPEPGQIFWVNHKRRHLVRNEGSIERIHLIVDAMAPNFTPKRGICFQPENITYLWDELEPLLAEHYDEVAHFQDIALDPDKEAYAALERLGQMRCYTARDGIRLVGYVFFFVRPNIHYRGSLQAHQDVLFLHRDHRKGFTGVRLIQFAERRLAAEGVQVVYHHAKRTNLVGSLLVRLGYELVDEIYAKRLDKRG